VGGLFAASLTYYNHGHFGDVVATAKSGTLTDLDNLTANDNYTSSVIYLTDCFK
jgi:hypothetical protein